MSDEYQTIHDRIHNTIVEHMADVKTFAAECRDNNHRPRCYVCATPEGLVLVAPGWGGVWACRACLAELDEQQQHKEIGHA